MSTQRGNGSRTRAQKYQNRTAFKNDLHDKTPQQKRLNSLRISEVCFHCKSVLEWKIKYKKYKALTQAKTCTKCQRRNILQAYHVLCRECSLAARVCAKCLKSFDEVQTEPAQLGVEDKLKLTGEMERLLKSLPERKRRSFIRYMNKGKTIEQSRQEATIEGCSDSNSDDDDDIQSGNKDSSKVLIQVPYTEDELLEKIEQLKLTTRSENENFSD